MMLCLVLAACATTKMAPQVETGTAGHGGPDGNFGAIPGGGITRGPASLPMVGSGYVEPEPVVEEETSLLAIGEGPMTGSAAPQRGWKSWFSAEESASAEPDFTEMRVFYGTDRNQLMEGGRVRYGRDFGPFDYGVTKVSIPREHKMAKLESPSWLKLEFREDPRKHVMVMGVERKTKDDFFSELKATTAASRRESVLVFVHGFNVAFDDAARRTAQLTYDLAFEGAPVFYSWPSQSQLSLTGYKTDADHAELAMPHLREFLNDVATRSGRGGSTSSPTAWGTGC